MKPNPSNNSNTRAHAPKTATAPAAAMSPGAAPVSIRLAKDDGGFLWLPVMLTALVVLPHVMACTYLPKTAWASFAVAVGLAWRRPAGPVWFRLTPLGAVWLAYISWALISLIWAPQPRLGLERWFELLLPTCAYLLARRIRFWESDRFWTCFYVLAGLVALIGLLQAFFSNLPLLQNIPGTKSPQTTEGQRNFASMFFLVCVPLFGWRYYVARDMRAALWPLAALLLSLAFIAVAGARGAWMGLAAAMAFLFATGIWRMAMRERNKTLLLSCLAGAGVVIALAFLARHPSRQFLETQAFQKRNIQETTKNLFTDYWRLDMWSKSLAMTHPLTGAGFGNFPVFATVRFRDAPVVDLNWEVHNDYIQAYLDLGVVGAFLHLLFFLMVIRLAWRGRAQGATLAAGMAAIAFSVMLLTTFAAYTITAQLAFAGVVAILNSQSDTRPVFQRQFSRRGAGAANAGIVLGMLGYALLACLTIWGDHQFRKVEYQLSDVQMQRQWLKVAGAQPEATLAPFKQRLADSEKNVRERIQYLLQRVMPRMRIAAYVEHYYCMAFGRYCLESGENDSARVFFQKALSLHPNDRQCLAYLSDIFIREGQPAMAIPYLEKGARVFGCNPYQPFARNLAWVYQQQGKPAEAALLLAKAENNKVACPVKPSPADGARNVPAAVTLAWEACRSAESYDVYVFPVGQTMPEMPSLSGLKKSEARLSLQPGVTYIWRVVATGPYDEQSGALWTFQTAPQIP